VDVEVHSGFTVLKTLNKERKTLLVRSRPVVLGVAIVLGHVPAGCGLPERHLPIVSIASHVDDELVEPAVVRHGSGLSDRTNAIDGEG